ncbi:MAG: BC85_0335 family putative methyltransferase [Metamycoplasmataceae bacterium]
MEISELTRDILIYSAIAVVIVALVVVSIIFYKIIKIKQSLKKKTLDILTSDSVVEGHLKVIQRPDFGEPLFELRDAVTNPVDDEIVEFTINTIIKNNFKNVLMLNYKTPYEIISISSKTGAEINVLANELDINEYNELSSKFNFDHNLNVWNKINITEKYDIILLLASTSNYLSIYEQYINNLKDGGMFLIANVKNNKLWKKELINKISKTNLNYDILNWYKGFILIVK